MARYAWIVDVDHIPFENAPEPSNLNAAGMMGPSDAPEDLVAALKWGQGRKWRIYDDDGELYYEGRILTTHPDGYDLQEEHFGPLWDFGTPNAGATEIEYLNDQGLWVTL